MASNVFGSFDIGQGVTVNSTQEVLGKKRFLNPDNEFEGVFVQPSIQANNTTISPTELSFLDGVTSNIQAQMANFVTLAQANTNYLGRLGTPTSLASVTTFNGAIVSGDINGAALGVINGSLATTGNLVFGTGNLTALQTGATQNFVFGTNSLALATTATSNIAIGVDCLRDTTTGAYNNALGVRTAQGVTTGNANNAYGSGALYRTSTGSFNVGVGNRAGEFNVTGSFNSYFGSGAGANSGTVSNCTAVGADAGKNSTGSGNTYLGSGSEVTGGVSNSTVVGSGASTAIANTIQLGKNTQNVNCPNTLSVGSTVTASSLSITDGVTTNTVSPAGYTTRNTVQNATHFINFSDSSATGTGAIQKNASLNCNPATGDLTVTGTLSGALNITDTNTDANFYPVFVGGSGGQTLNADVSTGPFVINPNTGAMSFSSTLKITDATLGCVAIGAGAGTVQGANSVAIGEAAGAAQDGNNVAIGNGAGSAQGASAVAIGRASGQSSAANTVSLGATAGQAGQLEGGVAIGFAAGKFSQQLHAIAIGTNAGLGVAGTYAQQTNAIAIGNGAAQCTAGSQGASSIAIGRLAASTGQAANSICLNASGVSLAAAVSGFFVNPIRFVNASTGLLSLFYNSSTSEVQAAIYPDFWGTTITAATTLAPPLARNYLVSAAAAYTITLPTPTDVQNAKITFRRSAFASALSFNSSGGGAVMVQITNNTAVTSATMSTAQYSTTFVCNGSLWYQIALQ